MRSGITPYLCTLALISLLVLPRSIFAETHDRSRLAPERFTRPSVVCDVALSHDGRVQGQLVDQQGIPRSDVQVAVQKSDGMVVANAVTGNDGRFVLNGLQSGQYAIRYGQHYVTTRLWAEGTSPPSARSALLLVADDVTVRGQSFPGTIGLTTAAAASAAAGAAVGKNAQDIINFKPSTPADPPPAS